VYISFSMQIDVYKQRNILGKIMNEDFFHVTNISTKTKKIAKDFHELSENLKTIEGNIHTIICMIDNFSNLNEKISQDKNILKDGDVLTLQ